MICELCQREVSELTEHHLVPKCTHKRNSIKKRFTKEELLKTVPACRECHKQLHDFYSEIELATNYYKKELILSDPKFSKFIEWVKKQRPKAQFKMGLRRGK